MKTIMFALFVIFVINIQSQVVQQAEYFFGPDPGYGNGVPVVLTSGKLVEVDFIAGTQNLNPGVHLLSIRAKGNETWSQTHTSLIGVGGDQIIQSAEYFFNTDPGYGNGISIPIAPGNVVELNFNANTSNLSPGVHVLCIRIQAGAWSQTLSGFIGVSGTEAIVRAEYFFDSDPGYGNGTAIPVNPGNVVELNFNANTSNLVPGIHMMHIRVQSGAWSQTFSRVIGISGEDEILGAEYFFDNDPGYGNGITIPVNAGNVFELDFVANTSMLTAGIHTLYLRVQGGAWSQTYSRIIAVSYDEGITRAEYFIGEDPGYGNGIAIPVAPGNLVMLDFDLDVESFINGYYQISMRAYSGAWSQTYNHEYCRAPVADFAADTVWAGAPTSFTNLSLNTDSNTEFKWDVNGDGIWDYTGGEDFLHIFALPGVYNVKLKAGLPDGCFDIIEKQVIVMSSVAVKILAEGPFVGVDNMTNTLNVKELIPLSQPYNHAPWNYTGPETVATVPNINVIDWVLVELRETSGDASDAVPATMISQQAAFLLTDGSVVGVDGSSMLRFSEEITTNLFVVIHHRNHLSVMSANPVTLTGNDYIYDFTTGSGQAHGGTNAQKQIASGVWGMIAGDINADGVINMADKSPEWEVMAGEAGYHQADVNFDGQVNNMDKDDFLIPNLGKSSMIPN
jgi:PKD repeat protein